MIILIALVLLGVAFLPVICIWCVKEEKGLEEGLKDWIDDSANDV